MTDETVPSITRTLAEMAARVEAAENERDEYKAYNSLLTKVYFDAIVRLRENPERTTRDDIADQMHAFLGAAFAKEEGT